MEAFKLPLNLTNPGEALTELDSPNLWVRVTTNNGQGGEICGQEYEAYKMCCYIFIARHRNILKAALQEYIDARKKND